MNTTKSGNVAIQSIKWRLFFDGGQEQSKTAVLAALGSIDGISQIGVDKTPQAALLFESPACPKVLLELRRACGNADVARGEATWQRSQAYPLSGHNGRFIQNSRCKVQHTKPVSLNEFVEGVTLALSH